MRALAKHPTEENPRALRERVLEEFRTAPDLYTTCRHCGKRRTGTMAELLKDCGCEHKKGT